MQKSSLPLKWLLLIPVAALLAGCATDDNLSNAGGIPTSIHLANEGLVEFNRLHLKNALPELWFPQSFGFEDGRTQAIRDQQKQASLADKGLYPFRLPIKVRKNFEPDPVWHYVMVKKSKRAAWELAEAWVATTNNVVLRRLR